jgi:hypothetical protein
LVVEMSLLSPSVSLTVRVQITSTVNSPGWATEETFQQSTRLADYVKISTKGLMELTQPVEWDECEA